MVTPRAHAQQEENNGPDRLSSARIEGLTTARRAAWTTYVARSRQLRSRDSASMAAELVAVGRTTMSKAPYAGPNFDLARRSDAWLKSDSARIIGEAVISFQTPSGGWSKRTDMTRTRPAGTSYYAETESWHYIPTFDNGATTGQMRFMTALAARHIDSRFASAFNRGLELLLAAQQPNGCWPQSFPLDGGYHDAITFNDDTNVLILELLGEVAAGKIDLATATQKRIAGESVRRGIACLVAVQVVVNGQPTVWGQQHDPITLEMVAARSYELAGLSGKESAAVMTYLMSLEKPDATVVRAVHGAAAWFRAHVLKGWRYDGFGLREDSSAAKPIWARLTEVSSDKPIFANRDGITLYDWNKLTDRRTGYAWFSTEPAEALRTYESWAREHPPTSQGEKDHE